MALGYIETEKISCKWFWTWNDSSNNTKQIRKVLRVIIVSVKFTVSYDS